MDGVSGSDGAPGVLLLSPISGVRHTGEEYPIQDEGTVQDKKLLDENNVVTVVDSADIELGSDAKDAEYGDRVETIPRRVRSKLPSEEEYVRLGMVSKVVAKLNSACSVEFRQAPLCLKKRSLLSLPTTTAHALTEIKSATDREESGSARSGSRVLSLKPSSFASEAKESSTQ